MRGEWQKHIALRCAPARTADVESEAGWNNWWRANFSSRWGRSVGQASKCGAGGASDLLNTIEFKSWDKLS